MSPTWVLHGSSIGLVWDQYGCSMGLTWVQHGSSMTVGLELGVMVQEVQDLQLAVQMRDDHLAECRHQSDLDQQQIDELERQLLMQV